MSKRTQTPSFNVRNQAGDACAEICIRGIIGYEWDENWNITDTEEYVLNQLKNIPEGTKINVRINSTGGAVQFALGIYNALSRRSKDVTAYIDGYAISSASIIPLSASKVISPVASVWMIHEAWTDLYGVTAAQARKGADMLETNCEALADIYAAKTGMDTTECRKMMETETWMTGQKAVDMGFADECCDDPVELEPLETENRFKNTPKNLLLAARPGEQIQTVAQAQCPDGPTAIPLPVAKEVAGGRTEPKSATHHQSIQPMPDTTPVAAPTGTAQNNPDISAIVTRMAEMETRAAKAEATIRRSTVSAAINQLVMSNQLTEVEREPAITRAMADETYIAELQKRPAVLPGGQPLALSLEVTASADDVSKGFVAFNAASDSFRRGNDVPMRTIAQNSTNKANFYAKHRSQIMAAAGDNTIAAGVQQQVILQESMRAFASKILALNAFSTVHSNIPLQGTDIINVPYYDLETAASTAWNAANGYVAGTTTTDTRAVTINKRKYQAMSITSSLFRRQPWLSVSKLMALKAEKLGVDVFADVLSVVTLANYGAATVTKAASLFDSDDVADLRGAANTANWPENGRALILNADYDAALTKDVAVKYAQNFAGNVAQTGAIPQLLGFNYFWANNIPSNSENLVGMAAFVSSIIVATSPIEPHPDVRVNMAAYELVTDPSTGITFEYRRSGNPQMDLGLETVECNYGYVKGNAAAIKRITSAA